jgi:hypothetical protein
VAAKKRKHEANTSQTPPTKRTIPGGVWVRFAILGALWLYMCGLLIATRQLSFWLLFVIIASGIIIFVPMYKKYIRNANRRT